MNKLIFTVSAALFVLLLTSSIQADNSINSLMKAAKNGDITALKSMIADNRDLNCKDDQGRTALMYAVIHGKAEAVKLLIDAKDQKGDTALIKAVWNDYTER